MKTRIFTLIATFALIAAPAHVEASVWVGTNPADANWDNPANWDIAPGADGGTVSIQNGFGPVVSGSTEATNLGLLELGTTANSFGSITITDSATIAVGGNIQAATNATGTAYIQINGSGYLGGGNLNFGNVATAVATVELSGQGYLRAGNTLHLGYSGTSTIFATGSSTISASTLQLGRTVGSLGLITLAGSSTLATLNANIGFYRSAGEITLTENSVMTVAATLNLGATAGDNASAVDSYGTLRLRDSAQLVVAGVINVGNFRRGTLSIDGNAMVTSGSVVISALQGSAAAMKGEGVILLTGNEIDGRGTLLTNALIQGAGTSGTVLFNGGVLRSSANNAAFLGSTGAVGMNLLLEEDGAFIDSNGYDIGISPAITITGSGDFAKIGAGSLTIDGIAAYTGATIVKEGSLVLGAANQLVASGTVEVAADATLKSIDINQILNNLSGAGSINLDKGTLTINSDGTSTFTGEIIAAGGLIKTGAGALTLGGNNTLGANSTLSEGILGIAHDGALGTSTLSIDSAATLRADANATITNSIHALGTQLHFDTLGAVTLTINGNITGTQGILKDGEGSIVLAGDSAGVSGAVTVNEGNLMVAGLNDAIVTVADGAGFGGSGVINGSVTYSGSGGLQIGATHNDSLVVTPATLTITNGLTLGDIAIKFDTYGNASDKLVASNITFGGQTDIDFSMISQGTFILIQTTSGTLDSTLASTINTTRTGFQSSDRETLAYSLSSDKKELSVTITKNNEALTWDGSGGDIWDYNNTASWAGSATTFIDGDRVTFSAAGSNAIEIDGNNVTAADMAVAGSGNYTFTGGGRITTDASSVGATNASFGAAPTGKFVMNGTGTVTFANSSNVFLGGLEILQGTVIGNADTLGKNADIDNAGSLVFNQDSNTSYLGNLHGAGFYAKTGSGVLTLTATNSTATGTFAVNEGSLILAKNAKLGAVAIANGAIFGGVGSAASVRAEGGSTVRVGIAIAGAEVGTETLTLGTLRLADTARLIGSGTLMANVIIDPAATAIADISENRELVLSGSLGGDGGFSKQGAGGLVFSQVASYAGATTIASGYLKAAAADVLSANSPHIIRAGGALRLDGHSQTIHSIANEGTVAISGPHGAGTRLTLVNGYIGGSSSKLAISLHATDNNPTAVDQLIVKGGEITGKSVIVLNVTDERANPADPSAYLTDIPALVISESGDMPTGVFTISDGTSIGRVVIGSHDYRLYYHQNQARLLASDSAEIPAVRAINPISIAINRATLNSLGQHLDHLRDIQTTADNQNRDRHLWLQGIYRRDRFYNSYWANTNGVQLGFDIPADTSAGGTVIYGGFVDYANSKIDLTGVFNKPTVSLSSKGLGAYMLLQHEAWCVDFAAKYSWDNYTIKVTDTPEFETDGASWGGFMRISYITKLKHAWTLVPHAQLVFQARGVDDVADAYGRTYTFGQKYARIDEANSLEGRLAVSARKLITLKSGNNLQPYLTFGYYHDFKGNMTVTTLNEREFHDDLGGSSFQVNVGLSAQLSKHLTAIIDAAIQNGGKIDSYSFNAGLSYRW